MKLGRNSKCPCKSGKKYRNCCGGSSIPAVDVANLTGIVIDPDAQQVRYYTKDILVNTLCRDSPVAAKSFDQLHEHDLRELSELLGTTLFLLTQGYENVTKKNDELRIVCANLCWNATNTFIGSTSLLRDGYYLQSAILIRSILETLATVMCIITTPTALSRFKKNELELKEIFPIAKKVVPPFGHIWGMFSETFVHVGSLHAKLHPLGPHQEDSEELAACLNFLRFSIWLIYVTVELLFVDMFQAGKYWAKIAPDQIQWRPTEATREWQDRFLCGNPPKGRPQEPS